MKIELTPQQQAIQDTCRSFVQEHIQPVADTLDREQQTPVELIRTIARNQYLGPFVSTEYGGQGMDMVTVGILHEEFGRGCSSLRSLLTVHGMVIYALCRWGTKQQKAQWLPRLVRGEIIAAFALSEPDAGSDAQSIQTTVTAQGTSFLINGHKKWITYGQVADVFLVFALYKGTVSAFLVERETPGLTVQPITEMLGTRASMLAELSFQDCSIPQENLVGKQNFGLQGVATSCLDFGRYSVACGAVGIAQACLDASLRYTSQRKQFGSYLKEYQLIQQMISDMLTGTQAARLLCYQAGYLKDAGDPASIMSTCMAKYFAAQIAAKAARAAVQIHGASGCSGEHSVQRYLRDATIMEIIEGSTQIQQIMIARYGYSNR
ncbi:hypothetical protein EI42_04049 [Thermosporothrix hazakensis]|jgi:alkylation response protein AidB-like acyl-CoA dehydrogenase|uniref:Alkylation response protein AidB-like acyl-CoA dehydrogenase n=2 Tax=Thermosporothrix TaxID=768650 RepID=A0A326U3P3_THEHA|nr:acyl-CoA dehydrogenase family protein [Thermosporothrix hazakensis]PZW26090.1 hypothetical protein EI42_04049 [Thermosporothrix hazakensis]BBH87063.1 acyl-CoA dehydrogenase [Thermosporothrix sp. COM3]GCE51349.1 acyl-CoA dehydrogenase [Thermosporothrix hazakensis]